MMKEFLLGGLLAIWITLLGLSTMNETFALLTVVYPVVVLFFVLQYQRLQRGKGLKRRKARKRFI